MSSKESISSTESMAYAKANGFPDYALDIRQRALKLYPTLPWPDFQKVKYHHWPLEEAIYTDQVSSFELDKEVKEDPMTSAQLLRVDQKTLLERMDKDLLEQGVIVTDLLTAMKEYPDFIKKYLNQAVPVEESRLTAFHMAHLLGGAFVYIPKNTKINKPIELDFWQDNTIRASFHQHVLLVADEGAEVELMEKWTSYGDVDNSGTIVVELIAKDNSKITYGTLDYLNKQSTIYMNRRGRLSANARIDWMVGAMSEGNLIGDFNADLAGEGSESYLNVIAATNGKQVKGIDTRVTNMAKRTVGHIKQHGVIMDQSTLTFNGIGHIWKNAKNADAQQESRVLMLSDQAQGDANPILLIDEFEVQAGHAASVGQVDDQQMYYLKSRGLDEETARRLVIRGFLGAVLQRVKRPEWRQAFAQLIDQKLAQDLAKHKK
ncbi:Fe-S cluster assembly protein SufD [Atopobacter sp. AH10]|uniref:Fe-S cluster assembly protein SufD n=1 Tax=Atopobacter sp. AH10 TaxID=2315861 RepID=UPI000EF244BD|nr:Fe-S cluster assembly protein SufD [Atopobacter sp. AH10]RLK64065.1 Fe-S cluster assembly protein SufD [Atopobacter sp. AH10]